MIVFKESAYEVCIMLLLLFFLRVGFKPLCTPCFVLSPGGPLVFKGGYDARTRKQVKRVIFFPTVDVCAYIEKGVKNSQIWGKGYVFQPLNCDMCLGFNTHS